MLDTGCLLEGSGNPDLAARLVEDSAFSGYTKRGSLKIQDPETSIQ